ncbi:MAG: NAD(P)H-dependent oxidoreductase subunit E [Bacteroidales bacterium]|nr:NAD(P)H-dependent oxidoreductase subunit E [Bacteroidales bacterium]
MEAKLKSIIEKHGKDAGRLMDILHDVQCEFGHIPCDAVKIVSKILNISKVDVEQTISFYHFFSTSPVGKNTIYLNDSVVANFMGREEIAKAFEKEAGCSLGNVSKDGMFGLFNTACIGMNDQEPAALVNGIVFTQLTASKVKDIVAGLKAGKKAKELVKSFGDGANASELVKSMVNNNIKKKGQVIFSEYATGSALQKLINKTPEDIINEIKASNIKGRGGAGFPTGMKWDFCRKAQGAEKYVICNADEGEPGTFKDRVLLTEIPQRVFEGMAVAGYAIGAKQGILYLRNEYLYLNAHLEKTLEDLKKKNLLGKNILGKQGFDFDVRIQLGAGAYICGEESGLIESAEGKRGEPRNRPPFPAQKGYLNKPTVVNNVETLASVIRIIEKGSEWYKSIGTKDSSGTKVLSISGDCKNPGVYEIEWGMTIKEMLDMCVAENVQAVQVAGPSGRLINEKEFSRKIANEDLATGGSMIVIGKQRNILKDVVKNFTEFFIDESCGSCVPCRALNPVLLQKLEKVISGKATSKDIDEMTRLGKMMKELNRCGLGQTAANPVLTSIENFRNKYEELIKIKEEQSVYEFDMNGAVKESCEMVGRKA